MSGFVSYSQLGNNGRLGNAMFQLAALISYSQRYNKAPIIPDWRYLKYFKSMPHPTYEIPKFGSFYNEPHFHYDEIPFFHGDVELTGYYQSHLYHDCVDVNGLFALKDEYQKQVDDLYSEIVTEHIYRKERFCTIKDVRTCAIHVRRSDYLNPGTFEYHGVLDMDYYNRAIKALCGDNISDVLFIVCSDDISWCKENFNHLPNVHFSEGESEITDMYLMSLCDSIVMANSSFSWWSARLGDKNKGKVAPSKWFSGANLKTA